MDADDFLEPEVGAAVALTALVCSPKVRKSLRQGAVYSVAGVWTLGDRVRGLFAGNRKATEVSRHE